VGDEDRLSPHARRAADTYGAAADHYRRQSLAFWARYGTQTVARLPLRPGHAVLDLCCGAGASALPAARAVGPAGHVVAIDVAEPLLRLGRAEAAREGLSNVGFSCADATRTGLPGLAFDAVICVFGVFFAADMAAFAAEMWRMVRPGGVLAITTWGPELFEPANSVFWASVRAIEPALFKAFNPWDEITTPAALADLFARAGIEGGAIAAQEGRSGLERPDDFWDIVLGSGYRATADAMTRQQQTVLRARVCAELRSAQVTELTTNVLFGTVHRQRHG